MIDVGIVGLASSHATAFANIVDEMDGMNLTSVWDDDRVGSDQHADEFCTEYGATQYDTVTGLAERVDAAMVLTVDWGTHVPLAEPLLAAGVPTLIDKPIADSVAAIEKLECSAENAPLFGGSAVPFHDSFTGLQRGGSDRTLFAAGYNDYFYYRVHLTDTIRFLAGANWTRVTPREAPGTTVDVRFENDIHATLRFDGSPSDSTFSVLDVGDTTTAVEIDSRGRGLSRMYEPYLACFRDVATGKDDHTDRLLDSATLQLAVETAITSDCDVTRSSEALADATVGSADFLADYDPYY